MKKQQSELANKENNETTDSVWTFYFACFVNASFNSQTVSFYIASTIRSLIYSKELTPDPRSDYHIARGVLGSISKRVGPLRRYLASLGMFLCNVTFKFIKCVLKNKLLIDTALPCIIIFRMKRQLSKISVHSSMVTLLVQSNTFLSWTCSYKN